MKREFMEEHLDMKLRDVLPIIQRRILDEGVYRGVKTWKCPTDLLVMASLIHEVKPNLIIELGTKHGGSAMFFADQMSLLADSGEEDKPRGVLTVDITSEHIAPIFWERYDGDRIYFFEGTAQSQVKKIESLVTPNDIVMVVEDTSHTTKNCLELLELYAPLVTVGSYFVVEDGIMNNGLERRPESNPKEAAEQWAKTHKNWSIDRELERYFITWNPGGFLKRIA